ncbi:MAG TPA: hypothetical protein VGD59_14650 [Acidisarcina sp.]
MTEKCPFVLHSTPASQPFASSGGSARVSGILIAEHPRSPAQAEANYRLAASRSHQKRGPPPQNIFSIV